jgi:hypothetical protein
MLEFCLVLGGDMGARGPAGKRIEHRLGNVTKAEIAAVDRISVPAPVVIPEPRSTWHAYAVEWYRDLRASAQTMYYEPSDWATALLVGDLLTMLHSGTVEPTGAFVAQIRGLMQDLLVTEAYRRRANVEIDRPKPAEDAAIGVYPTTGAIDDLF